MNSYKKVKDLEGNDRTDIIQLTRESGVISFVPEDLGNRDWQAYQEWLAQGNEPLEADE